MISLTNSDTGEILQIPESDITLVELPERRDTGSVLFLKSGIKISVKEEPFRIYEMMSTKFKR